ncbi:MAG: hypothetical protein PW789_14895 [Edaphobacter sp.]|uniref:hypothetical protein n=1 Tax=Edaphobacter sp. TaxID=1934404 RepID=UPI0023900B6F|nr:hypothetical protein [Edaphobacter sp.]MDE1177864.1 hypothetical protein [Edaphobacter sp.]
MLSAALILVSFLMGYIVVVSLIAFSNFVIPTYLRTFAVRNNQLSTGYKLLQDLLWLVCSLIGGYIVVAGSIEARPRITAILLAVALLIVMWRNMSEVRQRGLFHMMLSSLGIIIGVAGAYLLQLS